MSYTICIDIGYRFTGVVVYSDTKKRIIHTDCIRIKPLTRLSKAQQHFDECQNLAWELEKLFHDHPDCSVIVESPSGGGKSSIAVKSMASAISVLASVCSLLDIKTTLVTPLQIKRLVKAKGAVSKEEVQGLVEHSLSPIGFKYPNTYNWCKEHVADAGAVLIVASNEGLLNETLKLNK